MRRPWKRWAAVAGGAALLTLFSLAAAVTCKPAWYQPREIDYTRLDADKRDLVNLTDRIGDALHARTPIEITIAADQLNRWLAARSEWPELRDIRLDPFHKPYVEFLDHDRIRVGASASVAGASVVVSVTLSVHIAGERVLTTIESIRAGAAPAPASMVVDALRRELQRANDRSCHVEGNTISAPVDWVWPNGRQGYRVASIRIRAGSATLTLHPR